MKNRVKTIMLIDDNKIDNLFHERVIKKCNETLNVVVNESAEQGLEYLANSLNTLPEIIFLDINMPGMNGWEFIKAFKKLNMPVQNILIIVMLGTFETATPDMQENVKGLFAGFKPKPLTKESFNHVLEIYSN